MGNISLLLKGQELEAKNSCSQYPLCPARGFNNGVGGGIRFVVKNRYGEASFDYGLPSDESCLDTIDTHPSPSSVDNLDPKVSPSIDSVTATWFGNSEIDCVSKYDVQVCKEDVCGKAVAVEIDPHLSSFEFRSTEELEQCSDYIMYIKPLYKGKDLGETVVPFTTSAPPQPVAPENFSVRLNTDTNTIDISYNSVDCATSYKIYQKLDDSKEVVHSETKNNSIILDTPDPCVKSSYAVSALIKDEEGPKTEFLECNDREKVGSSSLIIIAITVVVVVALAVAVVAVNHTRRNPQNIKDVENGKDREKASLTNPLKCTQVVTSAAL